MRYRIRASLTFPLLAFVLLGCSLPWGSGIPRAGGPTPEAAARQLISHLSEPAPAEIRLHGTRAAWGGRIVLFTTKGRATGGPPDPSGMGFVLVEPQGTTWQAAGSHFGSSFAQPAMRIAYVSHPGIRQGDWIVYGRTLNPEVVAVEVTFDNGQILRDDVTGRYVRGNRHRRQDSLRGTGAGSTGDDRRA